MRGILTALLGENVHIACVPYVFTHCEEAELNIFFEVLNPALFPYASRNVWIPNLEWTYRTWEPYFSMVDEIWVKTHEAHEYLANRNISSTYIGWTSMSKGYADKLRFDRALVPVGKNIFRNPRPIFQAYLKVQENDPEMYAKLPTLVVQYNPDHVKVVVPDSISTKVELATADLKDTEYAELMKTCGVCICMSVAEGFGHAINECMSVGMNLLLSDIAPFHELAGETALYGEILTKIDHPDCFATLVDSTSDSIVNILTQYVQTPFKEKRKICEAVRDMFEARHTAWIARMKEVLVPLPPYSLTASFPKEEDLPDVSIITLTKNRREFMPLAKYCYLIQSYPEEKLEWIIVDDGEDSIEDTLMGIPNVVYVRCSGLTIAQKRNLGVQKAMYNTLVMMDDDDVYPENSVLHRVAMLGKEPAKQCGFCTTIPSYDIVQYKSFINVPPMTLHMSERISEATLIFTRKFWEENLFDESVRIAEGDSFVRGRELQCREFSPQEVIVSLVHPKTTSSRKTPEGEPNGCHFGFNEKLFALVSEIGGRLNTSGQIETGDDASSGASCDGDGHPLATQLPP